MLENNVLAVYFRCDNLTTAVETTFRTNVVWQNKVATVSASNKLWCIKMHIYSTASACASF